MPMGAGGSDCGRLKTTLVDYKMTGRVFRRDGFQEDPNSAARWTLDTLTTTSHRLQDASFLEEKPPLFGLLLHEHRKRGKRLW